MQLTIWLEQDEEQGVDDQEKLIINSQSVEISQGDADLYITIPSLEEGKPKFVLRIASDGRFKRETPSDERATE